MFSEKILTKLFFHYQTDLIYTYYIFIFQSNGVNQVRLIMKKFYNNFLQRSVEFSPMDSLVR